MKWYLKVLKEYANFTGRARREEYWMFTLFNMIAMIVLGIILGGIAAALESPFIILLLYVYLFAVMIPSVAVAVRRMHDAGKSGWYALIPIYSFILAITDSEPGKNKWGDNPKGIGNDSAINSIGKE